MSQTRQGWIDVAGATIHYEVAGHGPVLLLLLDNVNDAIALGGLAAEMRGYTIVFCGRRDEEATVGTHADDAARVLVAVTTHEAHVLGTGSGAVIGLDLAARHPHRVATLVAFEPDGSSDVDLTALRASHVRIVPAAGRDSRRQPSHDAATALARHLATPLVEFEGDGDAMFTQPVAFAAQLHRLLDTPGLVATP